MYDNGRCVWTDPMEEPMMYGNLDEWVLVAVRRFEVQPMGTTVLWVMPYTGLPFHDPRLRERLLIGSNSVDYETETSSLVALSMGIAPKSPGGCILCQYKQNPLETYLGFQFRYPLTGVATFDMTNQELINYNEDL